MQRTGSLRATGKLGQRTAEGETVSSENKASGLSNGHVLLSSSAHMGSSAITSTVMHITKYIESRRMGSDVDDRFCPLLLKKKNVYR